MRSTFAIALAACCMWALPARAEALSALLARVQLPVVGDAARLDTSLVAVVLDAEVLAIAESSAPTATTRVVRNVRERPIDPLEPSWYALGLHGSLVDMERARKTKIDRVALYVDGRVPLEQARVVVHTLQSSQRAVIVVVTGGGVPVVRAAPCARKAKTTTCAAPGVVVTEGGLYLTALDARAGPQGCAPVFVDDSSSGWRPTDAAWNAAPLAFPGRGCPAAPRREGPGVLRELLTSLRAATKTCDRAVVTIDPGRPWGELVPVIVELQRAGLRAIDVVALPVDVHDEGAACRAPVPLAALADPKQVPTGARALGHASDEHWPFAPPEQVGERARERDEAMRELQRMGLDRPPEGVSLPAYEPRPREQIVAAMDAARPALAACYERELVKDPSLGGRVVAAFEVQQDGAVADVVVVDRGLGSPGVQRCVAGVIGALKLPASRTPGPMDVSYPLVFGRADALPIGTR